MPVEQNTADKYGQWGWEICPFLHGREMANCLTELRVGRRRVGDAQCWSFLLEGGDEGGQLIFKEGHCSWSVKYSTQQLEHGADGMGEMDKVFKGMIKIDEELQ